MVFLMCVKAKKHHQTWEKHFTAMTNKIVTSIINFFISSEFYDSSNNGQFISSIILLGAISVKETLSMGVRKLTGAIDPETASPHLNST